MFDSKYPSSRFGFSWQALRLALVFAGGTFAVTATASYSDDPAALALVDSLVEAHGFEREALVAVMEDATYQQSIIDAITRPAEKSKPWHEYREIFLTEKREREGVEFFKEHREALSRAQAQTGVPAELIVAIIGVETYYGRIAGSYRVIDALATLAFDYPKRSPFFTRELEHFLLLTREQGMDPLTLKGSYAGAMGYGQFMPSSFRSYAVDFDGDGVADIWNNPDDAIGSVANYIARHGWTAGEPVVSAATVSDDTPPSLFTGKLKPAMSAAELQAQGVTFAQYVDPQSPVTPLRFDLEQGYEYWMGLPNFYVITRYNHSSMYAMSVYLLSQRIAAGVAD